MTAKRLMITSLGDSFGNCTELQVFERPEPGPGQVLVRNHFAGINGIYDQMMCYDRIDHSQTELPATCGVEAVGIIERVGSGVSHLSPDMSVSTAKVGHGYTTHHVISASEVTVIPKVSPEYLTLNPSGVSALLALERVGEVSSGEVVCISAAAGGLGNMLTQLALVKKNHVIAICGDTQKAQWLSSLGVNRVIHYKEESVASVLSKEYGDAINLGLDSVGGEIFDAMLANLAPHGRLVICGFTSDRLPTKKVTQERIYTSLYWKAASVRGYMNYRFAEHAPAALARLINMTDEGEIKPLVSMPLLSGLESVADGVKRLLSGKNLGKVVVDLRE